MRSAAYIMVTCDKCRRNTIRVELQETADGWNDRYANDELAGQGWLVVDGEDVCPDCVIDGKAKR